MTGAERFGLIVERPETPVPWARMRADIKQISSFSFLNSRADASLSFTSDKKKKKVTVERLGRVKYHPPESIAVSGFRTTRPFFKTRKYSVH
jgi:hypothetical protein